MDAADDAQGTGGRHATFLCSKSVDDAQDELKRVILGANTESANAPRLCISAGHQSE